MNNYNFVVDENFDQKRIDQVVAKHYPKISRSKVSKIIKTELLKLNGEVLKDPSHKVKSGDQIEFENLIEETINLIPKKMDLNICLLYTSPSPRDKRQSRMPSSA